MTVSKAQQKAVHKYVKANYDRMELTVPKGRKDIIKAHAQAQGESANGFINKAIDEKMERDKKGGTEPAIIVMKEREYKLGDNGSDDENTLFEKMYRFEHLFDDMLFRPGSIVEDFIKCTWEVDGKEKTGIIDLPPVLDQFDYANYFWARVDEIEGCAGLFDDKKQTIVISQEYINDDITLIHEMIHLHEFVLDSLPDFYRDVCLMCLYRDLKAKISDLDNIVYSSHILKYQTIYDQGGDHSLLFLLKSFDLDLKRECKLGTVFGYQLPDRGT